MAITCSADVPVYRLVDQEGEYNSYNDFPGMFDIEARSSPTEDSVTLYINGTNYHVWKFRCVFRHFKPAISSLILEFVGKFGANLS